MVFHAWIQSPSAGDWLVEIVRENLKYRYNKRGRIAGVRIGMPEPSVPVYLVGATQRYLDPRKLALIARALRPGDEEVRNSHDGMRLRRCIMGTSIKSFGLSEVPRRFIGPPIVTAGDDLIDNVIARLVWAKDGVYFSERTLDRWARAFLLPVDTRYLRAMGSRLKPLPIERAARMVEGASRSREYYHRRYLTLDVDQELLSEVPPLKTMSCYHCWRFIDNSHGTILIVCLGPNPERMLVSESWEYPLAVGRSYHNYCITAILARGGKI
jgi:hypothetical protein